MLEFSCKLCSHLALVVVAVVSIVTIWPNSVAGKVFPRQDYEAIDRFLGRGPIPQSRSQISDLEVARIMEFAIQSQKDLKRVASGGAVEQFIALNDMRDPSKRCNNKMHQIVQENIKNFSDEHFIVNLVINHFRELHADLCKTHFVDEYQSRVMQAGRSTIVQVENVLEDLLNYCIDNNGHPTSNDAILRIFKFLRVGSQTHTIKLVQGMKNVELNQNESKWLNRQTKVSNRKLEAVFQKYVVSPCANYVEAMGEEFYYLAESIGALTTNFGSHPPNDVLLARYFAGWARFKVCQQLVRYGARQMAIDAFDAHLCDGSG